MLSVNLDYSHFLEFQRKELNSSNTGFDTRQLKGEYEYPEHRWVLTGDWARGDWGVFMAVNYVGEFEDTPDIDFDGDGDGDLYGYVQSQHSPRGSFAYGKVTCAF